MVARNIHVRCQLLLQWHNGDRCLTIHSWLKSFKQMLFLKRKKSEFIFEFWLNLSHVLQNLFKGDGPIKILLLILILNNNSTISFFLFFEAFIFYFFDNLNWQTQDQNNNLFLTSFFFLFIKNSFFLLSFLIYLDGEFIWHILFWMIIILEWKSLSPWLVL